MDATRWRRLEGIFNAVADLPPGAVLDAEVRRLCAGDVALVDEVHTLLAEHYRLLDREAPNDPHVGLRLDAYHIDRLIARGGMASVYVAYRADDQFHQQVAIKIMDLRLSDPVLVAQFRAERQILATLEHPAVTRLVDGGVTALGEPYLVMEYVDGVAIDRYCDRERLEIGARVTLFRKVCDGIAFAHGKLVLHRDLKPSNVLVTADGHPKIVDFGTATLLNPERMATLSRAPLTPGYASPEQLTGHAMGTASDQYSLGLVLYELLTGAPPFGARASFMASIERAMAGTPPTAPHTVISEEAAAARQLSVAALRRRLSGDLGRILQKALAHEPAERYASVAQLADDLERWERGAPIVARPPSILYRASRFARTHWVAVSVAAVLTVALVIATLVALQQAARSRQQAALAQSESAQAQAVNQFLTDMLSSANPTWINSNPVSDGPLTVRRMLEGAGALLDRRPAVSPAAEAQMRQTLGQTLLGLGAYTESRPHLDRALVLYRDLSDAVGVARTQAALGLERVQAGDLDGAEVQLRAALAFVRAQSPAADPQLHFAILNDLGGAITHSRPGDPEAVSLLEEAVAVTRRTHIDDVGTGVALLHLGTEQLRTGQLDAALTTLTESLRRIETASVSERPERSSVLRALSVLMLARGDTIAAERFGAEAVASGGRARPADHPLQASYKSAWGAALVGVGRLAEGRGQLLAALATYRAIRPGGHFELMGPLTGLGRVARLQGQTAESERFLREAWTIAERHPAHTDRASEIAGELGLTLRTGLKHEEAHAFLQRSYEIARAAYGEGHPLTRQAAERMTRTAMFD